MGLRTADDGESRFAGYVEGLVSVIGHTDRAGPLRDYCVGLMLPCERKSVEPMAAVTAPERTAAQHQSLLHFVGNAAWSDEKVLAKVREMVLPEVERHGPYLRGFRRMPPRRKPDRAGMTTTSPGPETRCSLPSRNSILPLNIQTICSLAWLCDST